MTKVEIRKLLEHQKEMYNELAKIETILKTVEIEKQSHYRLSPDCYEQAIFLLKRRYNERCKKAETFSGRSMEELLSLSEPDKPQE